MDTSLPPALPDPATLQHQIAAALPPAWQVRWVDSTSSTNADLLALARSDHGQLARPWILGAHLQERGRGRAGRSWQNRAGANLMFSCAFDVFLPPRRMPTLSPLVGLAACEAMRALLAPAQRLNLTMKWPNDLLWHSAKWPASWTKSPVRHSPQSPDHYVAIIGMGTTLRRARMSQTESQ